MKYLIVYLDQEPPLFHLVADEGELDIASSDFTQSGCGEWTGFIDWLRTPNGKVIGLRYWPFEDAQEVLAKASLHSPSFEFGDQRLSVFFTEDHEYDVSLSGDQSLAPNWLSHSTSKGLVLVLECDDLNEDEQNQLKMLLLQSGR